MSEPRCLPLVSLETRRDRVLAGIYFALLAYTVAPLATAVHEGGHILAHVLAGDPVKGVFLSPFMGQVFSLYPAEPVPAQGWAGAAGPAAGLALGYFAAWLYLRPHRSWGLWGDTALLMLLWATILSEPGYLVMGSMLNIGDPSTISINLGLSRGGLMIAGVALVLVNAPVVYRACGHWCRTFAPGSTRARLGSVINVYLVAVACPAVCYWIPVMFYLGRQG